MPRTATILAFPQPSAETRDEIRYPGGHVVRIDRAHVARILEAKASVYRFAASRGRG